jgi:hypothetical protein
MGREWAEAVWVGMAGGRGLVGEAGHTTRLRVVRFVERYAWVVFVLLALLLLLIGISGPQGPSGPGSPLYAFGISNPTVLDVDIRFRGAVVLGMVIFSLAITLSPFRGGERWAWFVLWYWPLFFLLHVAAFGTWLPDLPFAILAAGSLLLSMRRYLGRPWERAPR